MHIPLESIRYFDERARVVETAYQNQSQLFPDYSLYSLHCRRHLRAATISVRAMNDDDENEVTDMATVNLATFGNLLFIVFDEAITHISAIFNVYKHFCPPSVHTRCDFIGKC